MAPTPSLLDVINLSGFSGMTAQSAQLLHHVLDNARDAFCILGPSGTVRYISAHYCAVLGVQQPDGPIVGRHISAFLSRHMLGLSSDTVREEELYMVSSAIHTHEVAFGIRKQRDGREILLTAIPVVDKIGRLQFVVQTVRDLSDYAALHGESESFYHEVHARTLEQSTQSFCAHSAAMQALLVRARRASQTDLPLLITGETGAGKGLLAQMLHAMSPRKTFPLVSVHCASIPPSLLGTELFGYEEGAFPGAQRGGKKGLVEQADRGTLLLDEIGDMPLATQAKLLQFLQDRSFYRVGGVEPVQLDVRLVATTHQDLQQKIREGAFREDLYYRLCVVPLHVPPLRERREDLLPLAEQFLCEAGAQYGQKKALNFDAQAALLVHAWPGNVRELRHCMQRLCALSEGDTITRAEVESDLHLQPPDALPYADTWESLQQGLLYQVLRMACRRYTSARQIARALGLSHTTVNQKLAQFGLSPGCAEA